MNRIKVFHFLNDNKGGVFSTVRNILQLKQSEHIEYHIIYTIDKNKNRHFNIPKLEGAETETVFYYSVNWNFYSTCKKLSSLIPDDKCILIAHDFLELGMISTLGLKNPVVQFLHGDYEYYFELAKKHRQSVDVFLGVSSVIVSKLRNILSEENERIQRFRFLIPDVNEKRHPSSRFNCIFFVRDITDPGKQFFKIPIIARALLEKGLNIKWHIAGSGLSKDEFSSLWSCDAEVEYYGLLDNKELTDLLLINDIMLLPSVYEGFPLSVIEAMKCGVVPLVSNWDGATDELIINRRNGFVFNRNETDGYIAAIETLYYKREELKNMSLEAIETANKLFNAAACTDAFENKIYFSLNHLKNKEPFFVYGSRLDKKWIPNFFTNTIRKIITGAA